MKQQILATYNRYTKEPVPKDKLDSTRSRIRYSFALAMNTSEPIAGRLANYVVLRRSPGTIQKLFTVYDSTAPEDIRQTAAKYFVEKHRSIVTLTTKKEATK